MRFLRILIGFVVLVAAASAAELKIKVVDPQSAAVAGAQVELFRGDSVDPGGHSDYLGRWAGYISRIRLCAVPRADSRRWICSTDRGYFVVRC